MYFVSFPVSTTNIFPLANSDAGGQLLSEFNLRSRESVATDPTIGYSVGPSYVHSDNDFSIEAANSTTIQINPGRAIVNGHYVELLAPITIDLAAVNYKAGLSNVTPLKGDLAVGLVMMYSTYETIAASALPENGDGYYEGVRVVIVPESSVKRPIDVPLESQYQEVNIHLLLGKFVFYGGTISNVQQNADKLKMYDASRIGNISSSLSDIYLSKEGLDPNKLYVFAGKTSNGTDVDGRDTWCEADDSLMIWDNNPRLTTTRPSATIAHFVYDPSGDGTTKLVLPHKQVDGAINQHGEHVYFPDMQYALPNATFAENSGGVVNSAYTRRIKHIEDMTNHFYRLPNGKMRAYIKELDADRYQLPPIPVGDGSVQPINISEIFADIQSYITEAYQALGPVNQSGTALYLLTAIKNSISSQAPYIDSPIISGVTDISDKLSNSGQFTTVVTQAISAINNHNYNGALSILNSLIGTNSGFPGAYGQLQNVLTALNTLKSIEGIGGSVLPQISDVAVKLELAVNDLGLASNLISSITNAIETYIQTEVNKRADAITVLTSSVWSPGDYVLVGSDKSMGATTAGTYPSTMYIVNYGKILTIRYVDVIEKTLNSEDLDYENQLDLVMHTVLPSLAGGVELDSIQLEEDPQGPPPLSTFRYTEYNGAVGTDYFVARYCTPRDSDGNETWYSYFYTPSSTEQQLSYIEDPILVTGGVPLATPTEVGGFLTIADVNNEVGKGYVTLDEDGHLRVVDFNLLLLGIQAQQLGQDLTVGSGMDSAAINESLEQYVNDRICYPNANQIKAIEDWNQENPTDIKDAHVINLYLELPETTDAETITIHDIGSRANSYLYVHITGSATSSLTVAFSNCDKLRVDSTIQGEPNLVFSNCNLYYDSNILSRAHSASGNGTGIYNLTLWYEQDIYADGTPKNGSPNLQVDGMTVTLVDDITSAVNVDLWDAQNPNDNHYAYGLRGLTFAGDGTITGISLLVADRSTTNIDLGTALFRSAFTIPQGQGLSYPENKLRHQLKVTGSFVTCYWSTVHGKFVVKETEFSALSQYYSGQNQLQPGSIGFMTKSSLQSHITGVADNTDTIDCWDLNQMNIFFGGAIN